MRHLQLLYCSFTPHYVNVLFPDLSLLHRSMMLALTPSGKSLQHDCLQCNAKHQWRGRELNKGCTHTHTGIFEGRFGGQRLAPLDLRICDGIWQACIRSRLDTYQFETALHQLIWLCGLNHADKLCNMFCSHGDSGNAYNVCKEMTT